MGYSKYEHGYNIDFDDTEDKHANNKKSAAWRKIEEYKLLQEFRKNLEFFDEATQLHYEDN